jgi:hypothetical protein
VILYAVCLCCIIHWQSLTGLLAFMLVHMYVNCGRSRWWGLCCMPMGFFLLNKGSVAGRWHILKVNLKVLHQFFPQSADSYAQAYNHTQIDYFKEHGLEAPGAIHANESAYALNDWLQLSVEQGFAGFAVVLILYLSFARLLWLTRTKPHICIAMLLPFYVFIFLSYPLHQPLLCSIFILLHLLFLRYYYLRYSALVIKYAGWLVIVTFFCGSGHSQYKQYKADQNETQGLEYWRAGYHTKALAQLQESAAGTVWSASGVIQTALWLQLSGRNYEALRFLHENHATACSYQYHLALADCYKERGAYMSAEAEYLNALHLVPHKFEARHRLLLLFLAQKKKDKIAYWAKSIVTQPVKVSCEQYNSYLADALRSLKNQ